MDENLKRWAGQVGAKDLSNATAPLTVGGLSAVRVNLTGSKNPAAGGPMMGRR